MNFLLIRSNIIVLVMILMMVVVLMVGVLLLLFLGVDGLIRVIWLLENIVLLRLRGIFGVGCWVYLVFIVLK